MISVRAYTYLDRYVTEVLQNACLGCGAPTRLIVRTYSDDVPTYTVGAVLALAESTHRVAVALVAGELGDVRPLCGCQTLTAETA